MATELVLFDLDDTLFAHRRAVNVGIAEFLRSIGETSGADDPAEVARWDTLEEHHYSRYLTGELDYLGQRRARATDFMAPYGVSFATNAAAEEWFEQYLVEYRRAWQLHDDALACLDVLEAAGVRVGIITNGDWEFQTRKLAALGITDRFEHLVTSGAFGIAKPRPEIFLHACELFALPPAAALYVGDRLGTDALGAIGAGLTGVWLHRAGEPEPERRARAEAGGAHIIGSLTELPALLGEAVSA